ncbi:peroxidase family protein [Dictyobacter formicarum]|uniref:peroxidase family protein n=1 Tax=Dictyobacter formicarum TaxID=2778368 RepID=UPI0019153624|nr:peroxidase family protein [Dictyobacter formicarum]
MIKTVLLRLYTRIVQALDQSVGWYRMPLLLGLVMLIAMRIILRKQNLYDTSGVKSTGSGKSSSGGENARYLVARTADGTYNDLDIPTMGSAGTRFGRNVPLQDAYPDTDSAILTPNPRIVSLELLARDTFQPATTLNLLAAAWIQFMIHDWFSHGKNQKENPWKVPLADNDPWPEHPMTILRTKSDPTRAQGPDGLPPTYLNAVTHWWDGSQIYGSDEATQTSVRSGKNGKLILGGDNLLPVDAATGIDITGVNGNWWVGLALLHTLFTLEHNAICDRLHAEYPSWSDDDLFDHARLVNAALMAKIHTINWTPAILSHPTLQVSMNGNWWGVATEKIYKLFGRISKSEVISGIPGSPKDHFGVPYAITEEFVSVYRMHPLLPDEISFRSAVNDELIQRRTFAEVVDKQAHETLEQICMTDVLYSFGTSYPGAITLHNYPRFLQQRTDLDGTIFDLATIEILRDRERGVPRYNEFRKLVHRPLIKSFDELTDNKVWAEELQRIYDNDIDKVDLMVGLYAERPPKGFGFSDTAFRIFILMASRRLNSDRFFTTDYTPTVYTQAGMDWIVNNDMTTVLLRHCPGLAPLLKGVKNAFAPWPNAKS